MIVRTRGDEQDRSVDMIVRTRVAWPRRQPAAARQQPAGSRRPAVARRRAGPRQRGMVLVTALLLLIVVTLLAVGMFRSYGLDEKIAGNVREKQRAVNAAETAEQFAEYWLASGNGSTGAPCTTAPLPGTVAQVCSNVLSTQVNDVKNVPWVINGAAVGVPYVPTVPTAMNVSASGGLGANGQGVYYSAPTFYISYLGALPSGLGNVFQIDAVGYGGSADTAAVVETTYAVQSGVKDLGVP